MDHGGEMFGTAAFYFEFAVRDRSRHDKCACLDAVGDNSMLGSAEALNALDLDDGCSRTLNSGAHFVEKLGEILDLGLFSGIFDHRFAFGKDRRHHHILSARNSNFFKIYRAADKTSLGRTRDDISGFERNSRAKLLKRLQMQVDRPRADGATARQAHLGLPESAKQRPKRQNARPHCLDQMIRSLKNLNVSRSYLMSAKFRRQNGRAEVLEQPPLSYEILYVGDIVKRNRVGGKQSRRQARQGGIFCTADLYLAFERIAFGRAASLRTSVIELRYAGS